MSDRRVGKPRMSLSETREFLSHVSKHPTLVEAVREFELDDREVARFIAMKAKTLFLVASHSNLEHLQKVAESLFYCAYASSRRRGDTQGVEAFDLDNLHSTEIAEHAEAGAEFTQ